MEGNKFLVAVESGVEAENTSNGKCVAQPPLDRLATFWNAASEPVMNVTASCP